MSITKCKGQNKFTTLADEIKIWVRSTAVHEGKHSKQLFCLHYFTHNHFISSFSFLASEHWQKNHSRSTRLGTFHHTLRGISKAPERRVQKTGLFVSSSTTAPRGVGEALLPFVLLPEVTRDIPPRQGGGRTEMCSSSTEQQLGKKEGMGLNPALTTWFSRSGLVFLNSWQNHGAWYHKEEKFKKKKKKTL